MNANVNANGDQMKKTTFVPTSDIRQALDALHAASAKSPEKGLKETALLRAYFTKLCWAVSDTGGGDLVTTVLKEMLDVSSRMNHIYETP